MYLLIDLLMSSLVNQPTSVFVGTEQRLPRAHDTKQTGDVVNSGAFRLIRIQDGARFVGLKQAHSYLPSYPRTWVFKIAGLPDTLNRD